MLPEHPLVSSLHASCARLPQPPEYATSTVSYVAAPQVENVKLSVVGAVQVNQASLAMLPQALGPSVDVPDVVKAKLPSPEIELAEEQSSAWAER